MQNVNVFNEVFSPPPQENMKNSGKRFYLHQNGKLNSSKKGKTINPHTKVYWPSPQSLRGSNMFEKTKNGTMMVEGIRPNRSKNRSKLHKMQLKIIRSSSNNKIPKDFF